ncbi:metabolite traffic protein EboE [Geomonas sp. RF6]|uniref:metabolite traffic protein EboE n=1 Tax=Geomonas sp. RF6 TaxID=2897342 RepID=UPI001E4FAA2B|nr:metabolite traffic protein EboE [Geomonas sp. RF6]UFS69562.1 metabolite traffic protein EboE [Geomonas sp. RF6]
MSEIQRRLITYCTNIHPAESWGETLSSLKRHLPKIKGAVSPDEPFPVGLRLSAAAVRSATAQGPAAFSRWLDENGLFVPTLNIFPFGIFHGGRLKEQVYLPDWRCAQRCEYTTLAASLLAEWMPEGITGSLSTVPVSFGRHLGKDDLLAVRRNILKALAVLDRIYQEKGRDIVLALEPEPACYLETTADLAIFLGRLELPPKLRQRLGICLDCCHLAVEFEEPAEALALLRREGVPVAKVHVSSALRVQHASRDLLVPFVEPCYLHQVVVRSAAGTLSRYRDLPYALMYHRGEEGDEWRCHFHIPLFMEESGPYCTTRFFAEKLLPLLDPGILLEVETYSWQVLPQNLRGETISEDVIKELQWLQEETDASHCRP